MFTFALDGQIVLGGQRDVHRFGEEQTALEVALV